MKLKIRLYSLFQFLSLLYLIFAILAFSLFCYNAAVEGGREINKDFWLNQLEKIFTFHYSLALSVFGSVLVYISICIWIFTVVIGLFVLKVDRKNFYDYVFLMFLFLPLFSNVFALMAQLTIKVNNFEALTVTKADIKKVGEKLKKEIVKEMSKKKVANK